MAHVPPASRTSSLTAATQRAPSLTAVARAPQPWSSRPASTTAATPPLSRPSPRATAMAKAVEAAAWARATRTPRPATATASPFAEAARTSFSSAALARAAKRRTMGATVSFVPPTVGLDSAPSASGNTFYASPAASRRLLERRPTPPPAVLAARRKAAAAERVAKAAAAVRNAAAKAGKLVAEGLTALAGSSGLAMIPGGPLVGQPEREEDRHEYAYYMSRQWRA